MYGVSMTVKLFMASACLVLAACGGDEPITFDEVAEEPGRKDVALMCDLYVQQVSQKTDRNAEAGFQEMSRIGVSEKGIEKAREAREEGREDYIEGVQECCKAFNKGIKTLNDTQTAFVYADMVLSSITRDMLTPAQRRAARQLQADSTDNMTRPENKAAYDARRMLPNCEKDVSSRVSRTSQEAIAKIIKEYR